VHYGERVKLPCMPTRTRGLVEFFFFFFFTSTFEREIFLNSRQKDFETLGWLEETSVIYCAKSHGQGSATCRSRSGRRGGCHNDWPAVGSRRVFGTYEASISVFEASFLGFNACLFGLSTSTPRIPSSCL
jgi:hypothetical protein